MVLKLFTSQAFLWIKYVVLTALSCFFLFFGVQVLVSAYTLTDPFSFIMTFFASNLIILISAALVLVFFYRMRALYRNRNHQ
jgi:hypothetical protein